ncbi:MAG: hypothetical protein IPH62_00725 [Ignavibacteriae bacterium]|nr:hypothetical protein [Ignavibacteriota bacterium]
MKILMVLFLFILLISCSDDSTIVEKEILLEYQERTSNSFYFESTAKVLVIENSIGFVNISGGSNSSEVSYTLDKTVKVKNSSLAQDAFNKIYLDSILKDDTTICKVISSIDDNTQKCNLSLIVPYHKPIIFKNSNGGVTISNHYSEIYAETDNYNCSVNNHNGSLEAHSTSGKISSSIYLPINGFCRCYSETGDIYLEIPNNSTLNIHLKTESCTTTYENLNINIISKSTKEVKGILNNGEGNLYLESKKGNITLKGVGNANSNDYSNSIKKEWYHSFEEEIDSIKIFRPYDYKEFPLTSYRQKYIFADNNVCQYFVLDPKDAHHYELGYWNYKSENQILEIQDSNYNLVAKYKILVLRTDLLKMVKY